ncbi:hypothetical protein CR513_30005, partial [Mucuna pruriens]
MRVNLDLLQEVREVTQVKEYTAKACIARRQKQKLAPKLRRNKTYEGVAKKVPSRHEEIRTVKVRPKRSPQGMKNKTYEGEPEKVPFRHEEIRPAKVWPKKVPSRREE